jgi:hypothetical protein
MSDGFMSTLIRRTALVALVWLTAASTLLAGLPQLECLCPSGQCTTSPQGPAPREGGRCCCGSCCAAGQGGEKPPKRMSCCSQNDTEQQTKPASPESKAAAGRRADSAGQGKPGPEQARLQRPGCTAQLVQPEAFTSASANPDADGSLGPVLAAALPVCLCPPVSPGAAAGRTCWLAYCIPPPTDLVIALQHFLI